MCSLVRLKGSINNTQLFFLGGRGTSKPYCPRFGKSDTIRWESNEDLSEWNHSGMEGKIVSVPSNGIMLVPAIGKAVLIH